MLWYIFAQKLVGQTQGETAMLGTKSANRLGMIGVILAESARTLPMFRFAGLDPFFAIREDSQDLTPEELDLLEEWVPRYVSKNYKPEGITDGRWGENIKTIFLFKRPSGWFWFRGSGRALWVNDTGTDPDAGAPLERVLEILMAE